MSMVRHSSMANQYVNMITKQRISVMWTGGSFASSVLVSHEVTNHHACLTFLSITSHGVKYTRYWHVSCVLRVQFFIAHINNVILHFLNLPFRNMSEGDVKFRSCLNMHQEVEKTLVTPTPGQDSRVILDD